MDLIKQEILAIFKSHPNIDQNKNYKSGTCYSTMIGNRSEGGFGASGINLQIYAMVNQGIFVLTLCEYSR